MSVDPFFGEIDILPYTFTPEGYVACEGQFLPITQYQALYAVIGINFGGNGQTTMGVPKLTGRVPTCWGEAPGRLRQDIGEFGGLNSVSLHYTQMPPHNHTWTVVGEPNSNIDQQINYTMGLAKAIDDPAQPTIPMYLEQNPPGTPALDTRFSDEAISIYGQSIGHANMQPFLGLRFYMAVMGVFPSRS
ncbi:phage tail protein [Novosphingobium beihaiensis]|uniref:Tail fiber protein n=1 Tax=Novosphingobium beihaiensis TaxID=2930389 RepID=A0ABT0BK03_9SPHN|nr:tail fiber protein [Novosphingobium beihaiensis]MCJ2185387.1 tail fiber protein [Novosphingobium beihaiensis]